MGQRDGKAHAYRVRSAWTGRVPGRGGDVRAAEARNGTSAVSPWEGLPAARRIDLAPKRMAGLAVPGRQGNGAIRDG